MQVPGSFAAAVRRRWSRSLRLGCQAVGGSALEDSIKFRCHSVSQMQLRYSSILGPNLAIEGSVMLHGVPDETALDDLVQRLFKLKAPKASVCCMIRL